ncbi:VWA domain-containing protein [Pseudodesulfovibrio indicus]|uniref:von Willebrand factor type A domain-containing protein n=1 Tax=Pseudodesulfovibrio indicus TaxID=1716143 RepID=A0AA94PQZ0_9BACT|nr:VWA domain-containing protein [Pseudodesulfovibrio indicus]TDT91904.1 von Willebrand factor type A domain-containing protein [Pseudodesulfovibrio indicus]
MVSKGLRFWAPLALLLWAVPVLAGGAPEAVRITQLSPLLPTLRIYAQVLDEQGEPAEPVDTDLLSVRIDGVKAETAKVTALSQGPSGVAYTLLVDISRTVADGPLQTALGDMLAFVDALGPGDLVAVGTFGDDYTLVLPFTADKDAIREALSAIRATDGLTVFYTGLNKALEMNKVQTAELPVRRAIVAVTDGKDEGSGLTLDDILERNRQTAIPVYTVGYTRIDQKHLFGLKRLAELTGGLSLVGGGENPFAVVAGDQNNGLLIEADCGYTADGGEHVVQVLLETGDRTLSAERKVAYLYVDEQALAGRDRQRLLYGGIGAGVVLLLLLLWLILRGRRRARVVLHEAPETPSATGADSFPEETESLDPDSPSFNGGDTTIIGDPDREVPILQAVNVVSENRLNPNCELVLMSDPDRGKRFQLYLAEEGVTVGAGVCGLTLTANQLDELQLGLLQSGGRFLIKPLSQDVETHVNGIPLAERTVLEHNDVIEAGTLRMRFLSLLGSDANH